MKCYLPLKIFLVLQRLTLNILTLRANFGLFGYYFFMGVCYYPSPTIC